MLRQVDVVEEHSQGVEVGSERAGGALGRENAGTSSKNASESLARRKPKVSRATGIVPGLVDPKARPKGVTDGRAG